MDILIANEANKHDHPLYNTPRIYISSTEMALKPGNNYLISGYLPFDFFMRCVFRALRLRNKVSVTVDARHQPSEIRKQTLVHFKLLYPEINILGKEAVEYVETEIAAIKQTTQVPAYISDHWRNVVEYPVDRYALVFPGTIVITGCSFSYGSGLDNPGRDRYDNLLGTHYGRRVVNLSYPGSSLEYAANTLKQAPLRADNIVVWQLTGILRWIKHSVEAYPESMPGVEFNIPVHDMEFFDDPTSINKSKKLYARKNLKVIVDTIDYLRSVGCKFVILAPDNFAVPLKIPERVRVETVDYGNDYTEVDGKMIFSHPGPKTHHAYATAVIQKLSELYGVK